MRDLHIAVGAGLFGLNLIAGVWGIFAWLTRRPSPVFWYLLRAAQTAVVLQLLLGGLLVASGHESISDIHYLYGVLPLAIMLVTETMRVGAAQQVVGETDYQKLPEDEARALALRIFVAETRVMALGCLIIAGLALRAAGTAGAL